jgi:hypothetical protein
VNWMRHFGPLCRFAHLELWPVSDRAESQSYKPLSLMDLAGLPRSLASTVDWAKYIKELKPLCIV